MTVARNLTRTAAQARAALINVTSYDVALDLTTPSETAFRSVTTVGFACAQPGAEVVVDVAARELVEASLNDQKVVTAGFDPAEGLCLRDLAATNTLTVVADFDYVAGARGMVRYTDPADGEIFLFTSFQPADAQRVFACFDQPDLKAVFTFRLRVPRAWRAVSNMPVAQREPDGPEADLVVFEPTPRISTYLPVVCAGPYVEVRDRSHGRDLGLFCRPAMLAHLDAENLFELTRRGLDFFEENFGFPYPLPKYDQIGTPGQPGAMENMGAVVFGERFLIFRSTPTIDDLVVRATIVLHEMAHMWFGDLVTMRWWDDLWLNEAFATWAAFWSAAAVTDLPEPWAFFVLQQKRSGIDADQLSTTHPIAADIPDVEATESNFDAITYRKGASVLQQLAAYVGIDDFLAAMRQYFHTYAWGNASADDLVAVLTAVSHRNVEDFAARWLRTASVNTLRPHLDLDADGRYTDVSVVQEAPDRYPTLRTHRIGVGVYDLVDGQLHRRRLLDVEVEGPRTAVRALRGEPAADLVLVNDDDLTFAKIRLDDRSLSTLLTHIADLPSAVSRAVCWLAALDMVNDTEMRTRDLVTLAVNGLARESVTSLIQAVVDFLQRALRFYADPAWAPQGWAAAAAMAHSAASAAPAGSAEQLTWVRAFAGFARSEADLAALGRWYTGTDLPEGVRLDPDLRWIMLKALVAGGAVGADAIAAERDRDNSPAGATHDLEARALIPTVVAKQAVWTMCTQNTELPLEDRILALYTYAHATDVELTPTYVADYLSLADRLPSEQGAEVGRYFALYAFPLAHISEDTLAAIAAWEAVGGHAPPVVRGVTEGRDHIVRALRARDCDRS
jgi:aminopeptidase N